MKTLIKTLALAILISTALFSCSKKSDSGTQPLTATSWTFGGTTYKGSFTGLTNNDLIATDNAVTAIPDIEMQFSGTPAAGTYTVVNNLTYNGMLSATQCYINMSDGNGDYEYYSYNGGTVMVKVNSGKITASFTNITMGPQNGFDGNGNPVFSSAGTVSGTLIEQ